MHPLILTEELKQDKLHSLVETYITGGEEKSIHFLVITAVGHNIRHSVISERSL